MQDAAAQSSSFAVRRRRQLRYRPFALLVRGSFLCQDLAYHEGHEEHEAEDNDEKPDARDLVSRGAPASDCQPSVPRMFCPFILFMVKYPVSPRTRAIGTRGTTLERSRQPRDIPGLDPSLCSTLAEKAGTKIETRIDRSRTGQVRCAKSMTAAG
jgi:hypothetical protein